MLTRKLQKPCKRHICPLFSSRTKLLLVIYFHLIKHDKYLVHYGFDTKTEKYTCPADL